MTPTERVEAALEAAGVAAEVVTFDATTHTAADAAAAVGCDLGQIVKTLFFIADGRPTMALVAGDRQADTARLAELLGTTRKKLRMGSPAEVEATTGYTVGAVSPFGTLTACDVVIDESLRRFEDVWAAAGASNAVFRINRAELAEKVDAQWAAITRPPA
jgi:Cys-tRNA(Pro) deacylase